METTTKRDQITIDAATLQERLENGGPTLVVDVRPGDQRAEWFIPGSIHVDAYEALRQDDVSALDRADLPTDQLVVTVCAAGRTSLTAARHLRERGLDAVSLDGGMRAWSRAFNTAIVPVDELPATIVQVRRTGKGCLSYVIGSGREAAVIDASLPPEVYRRIAGEYGWRIGYVIDTHIHADHLSRSRELAIVTGATLLLPEQKRVDFAFRAVRDGDEFQIGEVGLRAVHTPGHTDESMTYLLEEHALFTGDTLFIDGVGRPDLEAAGDQARTRAQALFDSLRRLRREAPDAALVLPGHTSRPVPFDGKAIAAPFHEVRTRMDLLPQEREAFVEHLLGRIPPTPPNYRRIVEMNEAGAEVPPDILDLEAGANRCAIS